MYNDATGAAESAEDSDDVIKDAFGNPLADGDDVLLVKDLKVKGSTQRTLKKGTKVRNIRLNPGGADGHDIDCKIEHFGATALKSSVVVKKA